MGFRDREYYREPPRGFAPGSVVTILIALNLAIWLAQVVTIRSGILVDLFACHPDEVFRQGHVWQILTANFLHDPRSIGHILGNMLFLFFFGREVEGIYGRRDFLIFYLAAGCVAIFAEAAIAFFGDRSAQILGASGAVMGTVVVFTLFYPRRQLYLGFLIPVEAWLLCIFYLLLDLSGALGGSRGVANWAHLAGATVGLAYWGLDLRTSKLEGRWSRLVRSIRSGLRRRPGPRLVRFDRPDPEDRPPSAPQPRAPARDQVVSERIDELLDKISRNGRASLTPEELEYLQKNSSRYRSGS
jgi:membrane associated rhomboid family serine protease